jgi:hypothetical protein
MLPNDHGVENHACSRLIGSQITVTHNQYLDELHLSITGKQCKQDETNLPARRSYKEKSDARTGIDTIVDGSIKRPMMLVPFHASCGGQQGTDASLLPRSSLAAFLHAGSVGSTARGVSRQQLPRFTAVRACGFRASLSNGPRAVPCVRAEDEAPRCPSDEATTIALLARNHVDHPSPEASPALAGPPVRALRAGRHATLIHHLRSVGRSSSWK